MSDHARIYLSPVCESIDCHTERMWCEDDMGSCDECGSPSIEYVNADEVDTLRARLAQAEADRDRMREALYEMYEHTDLDDGPLRIREQARAALAITPPEPGKGDGDGK